MISRGLNRLVVTRAQASNEAYTETLDAGFFPCCGRMMKEYYFSCPAPWGGSACWFAYRNIMMVPSILSSWLGRLSSTLGRLISWEYTQP
jgi:hypothetical protein